MACRPEHVLYPFCASTTKRLLLCSVLVLSNSPYKRDMDITDAGLVNLAGRWQSLTSLSRVGGRGQGGGGAVWGLSKG